LTVRFAVQQMSEKKSRGKEQMRSSSKTSDNAGESPKNESEKKMKQVKVKKSGSAFSWMSVAFLFMGIAIGVGPFVPQIIEHFNGMQNAKDVKNEDAKMPDNLHQKYLNHYSRFFQSSEQYKELSEAKKKFLASDLGSLYGYGNLRVEDIVASELERFENEIYLDYTGAGVYQKKQLTAAFEDLAHNAYGNAHSENPSSARTGRVVDEMRSKLLKHFNVTEAQYTVIFTSGATGALKLVAESFPWTNRSRFVYLRQNHNSVLGIREIALDQGASFEPIPESEMSDGTCSELFGGSPCQSGSAAHKKSVLLTDFPESTYNLFAYPALDNFAGVKYPLEWINMFHKKSRGEEGTGKWLVLLDSAAFVPTHTLDLSKYPADFVSMSFYKMFGYPTGLGALLVRNEVTELMQKTFFGGGTVSMSSCDKHFCQLIQNPCSKFEDGTVSFLSISEVAEGLGCLENISGTPRGADMSAITNHTWSLTRWLYNELKEMKHSNGAPLFKFNGKHDLPNAREVQGSIVNLLVLNPNGTVVGYHDVQKKTSDAHIHIRTGCNCNPGACYDYLGLSSDEVIEYSLTKTSCHDDNDTTENGKPLGATRVSIGYLTTFEDVFVFARTMKELFLQ